MKIIKKYAIVALLIITGICSFGFMNVGNYISSAKINNFNLRGDSYYLDTTVNINFDALAVKDIKSIKFEICKENECVGYAISQGENLTALLKNAAKFWDKTADTYLEVTGVRTLTCNFTERKKFQDNGFWQRSVCSLSKEDPPTLLKVTIKTAKGTETITNK